MTAAVAIVVGAWLVAALAYREPPQVNSTAHLEVKERP